MRYRIYDGSYTHFGDSIVSIKLETNLGCRPNNGGDGASGGPAAGRGPKF